MEIVEKAHAKINLSLRVLNKENGYHKVETVMVPLELADYIYVSEYDHFRYDTSIPNDFVLKTANLFFEKYKVPKNVYIRLEKNIPMSAGLAGGSSDSSALLRALNRFYNLNLELKELEELANLMGSDNAYCLYQKPALCSGRGEKVELLKENNYSIDVILIKPNFGLSTKEVYENYSYQDYDYDVSNLIEAINNKDIKNIKNNIINDLSKPALKISKELNDIVSFLKENNIDAYQSGSGPTYYTFDIDKFDFLKANLNCSIYLTKINL